MLADADPTAGVSSTAAAMQQRYADAQRLYRERKKAQTQALEAQVAELQRQVEAASLETVRDRAQLATLASYAEQRPAPKREVDVRKLQLKMDPFQQAVEGRQLDGSFALDDDGAMLVASLVAAVYGSGDPRCNPAQCRRVQTGLLIGMYEDLRGRMRDLLRRGAEVDSSAAARELEQTLDTFHLLWGMADTAAVWRASRALYFAVLNELVNGAEAEHGPWPMEDFDAKLAAMQLTPEQQGEFAAEANAMTWRLCELVRQHKALLLGICKTPLTASSTRPDTVTMSDVHSLVQQLQAVLGEYGVAFWGRFRPVQLARAAVATPYPLCAVSVGVHILGLRQSPGAPTIQRMMGVMDWLRGGEGQAQGPLSAADCVNVPVGALFAFAGMEDTNVGSGGVLRSLAAVAGTEDTGGDAGEVVEANLALAGSDGVISEDHGPSSIATSHTGS